MTPLHLPARVRTVLVYGGSFDPPHRAHLELPLALCDRLFGSTGLVLYVPAARNPLKQASPRAGNTARLAMLHTALAGHRSARVWPGELTESRQPSYTVHTLRRLRRLIPPRIALRLLIGSDQLASFHRWKSPRAILKLAPPLVMPRAPLITALDCWQALDSDFWTKAEQAAWCTRLAPCEVQPAASTDFRAALAHPATRRRALAQLPPLVAAYIRDHDLYT